MFYKCDTNNMIRFNDFNTYEVANILFMLEVVGFFKRINGFKRYLHAMKFPACSPLFIRKNVVYKIKWGLWNEKSNCIVVPSSLATGNGPHTKLLHVLVTYSTYFYIWNYFIFYSLIHNYSKYDSMEKTFLNTFLQIISQPHYIYNILY